MSGNTTGLLFTVTSFGESHGPAIGCVVDGCPPGLAISAEEIQQELDRRKPGTSRMSPSAASLMPWKSCPASTKAGPPAHRLPC